MKLVPWGLLVFLGSLGLLSWLVAIGKLAPEVLISPVAAFTGWLFRPPTDLPP